MFRLCTALLGLFLLAAFLVLPAAAQNQDPSLTPEEGEEMEPDWLEFYYRDPRPEEFVEQMKTYSKEGVLMSEAARPALVAFISQVIRQNRDKLGGWYGELRGLSPEEMQVIHTGMLYSRTAEADALLEAAFGDQLEQQRKDLPKILELQLDRQQTLDMLWGFFYATGSENAVRRIVSSFNFVNETAPPDGADVPSGFRPLYEEIPEAAAWSLFSNAIRHPKVETICKDLLKDEEALNPTERRMLKAEVLDRLEEARNTLPERG